MRIENWQNKMWREREQVSQENYWDKERSNIFIYYKQQSAARPLTGFNAQQCIMIQCKNYVKLAWQYFSSSERE